MKKCICPNCEIELSVDRGKVRLFKKKKEIVYEDLDIVAERIAKRLKNADVFYIKLT